MNRRRFGSASANHGKSHNPYWGEYTLLVRRNRIRIGRPSVQRGNPGSRPAFSRQTSATVVANASPDATLIRRTFPHEKSPVTRWQAMNHRLSQSAGRAELKRKNSHQPVGAATANGRLRASHAPAAAHARWIPRSGSRAWNRPATNGTTSRAG